MVEVNLWSGLKPFTGGETVVEVEAETVGQILDTLIARHEGLAPVIAAGVSVAIDGEIVNGRNVAVPAGAEVYLMRRIKGG